MVTPPMHQTNRRYIQGSDGNPIFTYLSYGGFTFPAAINLKINIEPVYDSSGRLPKWYKHIFTVETVIDPTLTPENDASGAYPVDLNMSQIRRRLLLPGQPLTIWNLGIGQNQRLDSSAKSPTGLSGTGTVPEPSPFNNPSTGTPIKQDPVITTAGINTFPDPRSSHHSFYTDNLSDLNFGPKPQLLSCECIGGSRAYRIVWTVECALPNCCVEATAAGLTFCTTPSAFNGLGGGFTSTTEFNYSLSWSIDEDRFTTFTIVGSTENAGSLITDISGVDKAVFVTGTLKTEYVTRLLQNTFYLRPGFNRSIQYDLSRDYRKIDFRITDREIPSDNAYYPGIKSCSLRHSVSGSPYGAKWNIGFDGDFEVQPGVPKYVGLLAMVSVISNRMANLSLVATEGDARGKDGKILKFKAFYMPKNFSFEEDIFSRRTSFSFNFLGIFTFDKLLENTRFFANTSETWADHRNNLSPFVLKLDGTAGIATTRYGPLNNICRNPKDYVDITSGTWFKPTPGQQYSLFESECPEFNRSIIQVDYYIALETNTSVVSQRPAKYVGSTFNTDSTPGGNGDGKGDSNLALKTPTDKIPIIPSHQSQKDAQLISPGSPQPQGRSGFDLTLQSFGAPENYLIVKAAVQTLCHDIKGFEVRSLDVYKDGETKTIKPIVKHFFIESAVEDERAKVPKKTFFIEAWYQIEGTPLGSARVSINGTDAKDTVQAIIANTDPGTTGTKVGQIKSFSN